MPDVLWLFEYPTLNGGERSLLATLPALRQAGFRPAALSPASGPLAAALTALGVPLVPIACQGPNGTRRPLDVLRAELAALLRRLRPDLLHANSLSMGRLSGPVAAELGLSSIAHLRDIVGLSRTAVADLARHTRLLAVSAAVRDFYLAHGIPARQSEPIRRGGTALTANDDTIHVLYNGVDLDRFRPRPATGWLKRELGLPPGAMLAGCIGQLILRKGQDVLATAAERLATTVPELHYCFVGERYSTKLEAQEYEAMLRARFASGRLSGRGHFLGTRDEMDRLLPELDLVVHPARQEPLGRVLLEAAAAGRPIVATCAGGSPEIFPPLSQAARVVPPDDPAALADALRNLAASEQVRADLGRRARARAEEAFDIRTAAAGLAEHYRQTINTFPQKSTLTPQLVAP